MIFCDSKEEKNGEGKQEKQENLGDFISPEDEDTPDLLKHGQKVGLVTTQTEIAETDF